MGAAFRVRDVSLAPPGPGEVRVGVAATGVCRSDLHVQNGLTPQPMPIVAGHEGAGVVTEVGDDVTRVSVGDHVALSWVPICGKCFFCTNDMEVHCETTLEAKWAGTMPSGAIPMSGDGVGIAQFCSLGTFAEEIIVSELSCVSVHDGVPLEVVALIGCAVATGVGAVLNTAQVEQGSTVVVLGCGGVGLNVIQGAVIAGAETIVAVDIHDAKLSTATDFGATMALAGSGDSVTDAIKAVTHGRGADYVFDTTGHPPTMAAAYDAVRRAGTVVYVGVGAPEDRVELSPARLPREGKRLLGSYYGSINPTRDFPKLIDMYAAGDLRLDELITARYPLDDINQAFADLESGKLARGLIQL